MGIIDVCWDVLRERVVGVYGDQSEGRHYRGIPEHGVLGKYTGGFAEGCSGPSVGVGNWIAWGACLAIIGVCWGRWPLLGCDWGLRVRWMEFGLGCRMLWRTQGVLGSSENRAKARFGYSCCIPRSLEWNGCVILRYTVVTSRIWGR